MNVFFFLQVLKTRLLWFSQNVFFNYYYYNTNVLLFFLGQ